MKSINIPLQLCAADRKQKILGIIDQDAKGGTIEIVFERAGPGGAIMSTSLAWRDDEFQNAASPRQIAALVAKIDRQIEEAAYARRNRAYSFLTVTVIIRQT